MREWKQLSSQLYATGPWTQQLSSVFNEDYTSPAVRQVGVLVNQMNIPEKSTPKYTQN